MAEASKLSRPMLSLFVSAVLKEVPADLLNRTKYLFQYSRQTIAVKPYTMPNYSQK
jgi:hypothetical protein